MRAEIINYCESRYKFFGTGPINWLYMKIIIMLNNSYLWGLR